MYCTQKTNPFSTGVAEILGFLSTRRRYAQKPRECVRRYGVRAGVVPADHDHRDGRDEDDAGASLLNRRRYCMRRYELAATNPS